MVDREARIPIIVGLVVSLGIHAVVLGTRALAWLAGRFEPARPWVDQTEADLLIPEPQPRDELLPGQLEPGVSHINLITWDDLRELKAPKRPFDQPALQRQVDPSDIARDAPVDPTPPAMNTPPQPPTQANTGMIDPPQPARSNQPAGAAPPSRMLILPGPEADLPETALPSDPVRPQIEIAQTHQQQQDNQPSPNATESADPAQAPPSAARPTLAQRSHSEAPPVSRVQDQQVQPGEVLSVQGVKIKTVTPRFSQIARMTSLPRDPCVDVIFNAQGEVIEARIVRSSGFANVDSPILNSLYQWTAEGPIDDRFVLDNLRIMLGVEGVD
jgi:hypothetical protein